MEVRFDGVVAKQMMKDVSVYRNNREILHICCARVLAEDELISTIKGFLYGFSIPEKAR